MLQGSVEALKDSIEALSTDVVRIKILHMGVGPVSKANIDEAAITNARIIAFNVKTNGPGVEAANKEAQIEVCFCREYAKRGVGVEYPCSGRTPMLS